jgi:undecaprenyl-diphosphatase
MEFLSAIDISLFRAINELAGNSIVDAVMRFISNRNVWIATVAIALIVMTIKKNKFGLKFLLVAGILVGVTDAFCFNVLKPGLGRDRPCYGLENVTLSQPSCGSQYGLPSNHAANGMALTVAVYLYFGGPLAWYVLGLTLLVGISRIYLGVHYPLDVLLGFLVGGGISYFGVLSVRRWIPKLA